MIDHEQQLRITMARSERAQTLLDDPLLVEAFDQLEQKWLLAWRISPSRDSEGRERIWLHLKALEELKAQLETVLQDGIMAKHQLDELRSGQTENPL